MLLGSQSWKSWGTGEMDDGVIFDAVYVQGCVRSCSPEYRKNQAKWVSLWQHSIAEAQWWISLGREVGCAVAITAVQYGLCIKQNSSSALPSLPASLHQCTGMSDAAASAVMHRWGAGCFHHSFSFLFLLYCLHLLFCLSALFPFSKNS